MDIYQATAELKWTGWKISGTGPIAVLYHCRAEIILCALPLQVSALVGTECAGCREAWRNGKLQHQVVTMKKPVEIYNGPRTVPRNRIWERDRREVNA